MRNKKLAVIDSLNLTKYQKDALYRLCDYAEKRWRDVPWYKR